MTCTDIKHLWEKPLHGKLARAAVMSEKGVDRGIRSLLGNYQQNKDEGKMARNRTPGLKAERL